MIKRGSAQQLKVSTTDAYEGERFAAANTILVLWSSVVFFAISSTGYLAQFSSSRILAFVFLVTCVLCILQKALFKGVSTTTLFALCFFLVCTFSTWQESGSIVSFGVKLLPCLTAFFLFETYEGEALLTILRVFAFWGSLLIVADLISIIAYPDGMYESDLYTQNWLLGYKSQRGWLGIPIISFVCVLTYMKKGKISPLAYALALVLAISCYLVEASMCTAAVVLMLVGMLLLDLRRFNIFNTLLSKLTDFRLWMLLVLIVCITLYVANELSWLSGVLELLGKSDTLSSRTIIWEKTIDSFLENPLIGTGYIDSEAYMLMTGVRGATNAHSFCLEVFKEGGVIGALFLACAFVSAFKTYKSEASSPTSLLMLTITVNFFMGITSCNLYATFTLPLLVLLARSDALFVKDGKRAVQPLREGMRVEQENACGI